MMCRARGFLDTIVVDTMFAVSVVVYFLDATRGSGPCFFSRRFQEAALPGFGEVMAI